MTIFRVPILKRKTSFQVTQVLRPLVDDGSETESKTSREHVIINDPRNVTFLSGGKYTTYRQMAEDTVEAVLNKLQYTEEQVLWGQI